MNDERTIYMLAAAMLAVYVVLYLISRQWTYQIHTCTHTLTMN